MKQLLRFVPLLLSFFISVGAWAALSVNDTFTAGGITYKVTSTSPLEVQVGDGKNNAVSTNEPGYVTIPAMVTGSDGYSYAVTSIGDNSFYKVTGMTAITIPSSVKSIIKGAFIGCTGLTAVHITDLAAWCNIYFNTEGIKILIRNGKPTSSFNPLFYASLFVNGSEVTDLVIPSSVTTISDYVFCDFQTLRSVTIGSSVTSIGKSAFNRCPNLTSISLGNSVKTIGNSAFSACSSLSSVIIPSQVDSIGGSAFSNCTALNVIKVDSGNNTFDSRENCNAIIKTSTNTLIQGCKSSTIPISVTTIGNSAFYNCKGLTTMVIPNSVTDIERYAFSGCTDLLSVTIPSSVGNIGSYAFQECSALTSVTIPSSVSEINNYTFSGCKSLASVSIPSSVTSIGEEAFYSCSILRAINIPQSVKTIGKEAFAYCDSLASITVESGNAVYDSRENCNAIIETTTNTLIQGCKTTTIPASTVTIGSSAFHGCHGLQAITIPDGVASIGTMAFCGCNRLTTVTIPASVTSIGSTAFSYCYAVKEWQTLITEPFAISGDVFNGRYDVPLYVPIGTEAKYRSTDGWNKFSTIIEDDPNSSVKIGDVFTANGITYKVLSNSPLTVQVGLGEQNSPAIDVATEGDVDIPATVSDGQGNSFIVTIIAPYAFDRCSKLTSVTIPVSVTSIGQGAFGGCSNITKATIPAGVTSIETGTFSGCRNLASIDIPASVTSIGRSSFYGCSSLTSLTIPASVKEIGNDAFVNCYSLASLTIPASVTSIGLNAFGICYGLTAISVDSRNTVYDSRGGCNAIIVTATDELFQGCRNTVIPNTVKSIGETAFNGCNTLSAITIPASVTNIGRAAFSGCNALSTITIPSSVKSIGQNAFNCNALAAINSQITEPYAIAKSVFSDNIYANCMLTVPTGTHEKYLALEGWKEFQNMAEPASEGSVFISGGITYRIESLSDVTVAVGDGNSTAIATSTSGAFTIPSAVTHPGSGIRLTVTGISNRAFSGCVGLTSVTLPATLTTIGTGAFQGCTGLNEVRSMMRKPMAIGADVFSNFSIPLYIPAGTRSDYMATSGWRVFAIMQELKALSEGDSFTADGITYKVTSTNPLEVQVGTAIGTETSSTSSMRAIDLNKTGKLFIPSAVSGSDGNEYNVVSIGKWAFLGCRISSVIIPYGVTHISSSAFSACQNLTSLFIPGSVSTIADYAFDGLPNLNSLTLPEGLTSIGRCSFRGCSAITSLHIPKTLENIGGAAFAGCTGLTAITVDANNPVYDSRGGCNAIIMKNNGSWNSDYLIAGCANTVIPDGVRGIGDDAFYNVENLTKIAIPATVTFIGNDAFNGCKGLKSVTLPKVEIMYMRAFANCTGLTSVTIPATARHISETVFMGCSGLESIKVDKDNTTFETDGRYNAIIHIANKKLLAACKNTIIPDYVTIIDNAAFNGCTGLKSITLPAGLTSIGNFNSCTALTEVVSRIAEPYAISNVFSPQSYGGVLKVPYGKKKRYETTDGWKNFKNIVEMERTMKGDVNGDGVVDVADIASVISYMASGSAGDPPASADVNGDGQVDVADIATIIDEMAARARKQNE